MENTAVQFVAGTSVSSVVKLAGNTLLALQFGTLWTSADISFLGSGDGVTFGPIYDDQGNNVSLTVPSLVSNMIVCLSPDILATIGKFHWLKFVSGSYVSQTNQSANTSLTLIFGSF